MHRVIKKAVSAIVGLVALTALVSGNQAFAVDCRSNLDSGELPFSNPYIASNWTRSGNAISADTSAITTIRWEPNEFLGIVEFYCEGTDWRYDPNMTQFPQISINNFPGYLNLAPGVELSVTIKVTYMPDHVILDTSTGWSSDGTGAECTVSTTNTNTCVMRFGPDPDNSSEYAFYSQESTAILTVMSAEMTIPSSLTFADPLQTVYLVPSAGNLIDFVYYIPPGLGYATDNDEYTNPCGDNDDGSNITVPPLPVIPENGPVPAPQRTIACPEPPNGVIPATTVHLPYNLGGPGLAVNLSTCELTSNAVTVDLGMWTKSAGTKVGNAEPINIQLSCTGGLNNVSVVFEDAKHGQTGVTPYTDGITLHGSGASGQLKNVKAEILHNNTALVNIRPAGNTSLDDAVSVGTQGTMYTGPRANAPTTQVGVNQFSVRLNQTGPILDAANNPYTGAFEGVAKFTMIYN